MSKPRKSKERAPKVEVVRFVATRDERNAIFRAAASRDESVSQFIRAVLAAEIDEPRGKLLERRNASVRELEAVREKYAKVLEEVLSLRAEVRQYEAAEKIPMSDGVEVVRATFWQVLSREETEAIEARPIEERAVLYGRLNEYVIRCVKEGKIPLDITSTRKGGARVAPIQFFSWLVERSTPAEKSELRKILLAPIENEEAKPSGRERKSHGPRSA